MPALLQGCDGPGPSAVRAIAVEGLYLTLGNLSRWMLSSFVATPSSRQVVFITSGHEAALMLPPTDVGRSPCARREQQPFTFCLEAVGSSAVVSVFGVDECVSRNTSSSWVQPASFQFAFLDFAVTRCSELFRARASLAIYGPVRFGFASGIPLALPGSCCCMLASVVTQRLCL